MSEENNNVMTGTISEISPVQDVSGGAYRKQAFTIKNDTGYKGKEAVYAFEIFEAADKDKIEKFNKFNKVGSFVDVSYEIRCNEGKSGGYFTTLSAWKVFKADTNEPTEATSEEAPF